MRNFLVSVLFALVIMTSCQGPQGIQGPAGVDGNANVQSATVETKFTDWTWSENDRNWTIAFDWDQINFDIVDYGALLVYMENPDSTIYAWHQLPFSFQIYNGNLGLFETSYYDYGFAVFLKYTDGKPNEELLADFYAMEPLMFKVVIIGASAYAAHPYCNYSDYEEVKKTFNIE